MKKRVCQCYLFFMFLVINHVLRGRLVINHLILTWRLCFLWGNMFFFSSMWWWSSEVRTLNERGMPIAILPRLLHVPSGAAVCARQVTDVSLSMWAGQPPSWAKLGHFVIFLIGTNVTLPTSHSHSMATKASLIEWTELSLSQVVVITRGPLDDMAYICGHVRLQDSGFGYGWCQFFIVQTIYMNYHHLYVLVDLKYPKSNKEKKNPPDFIF